MKIRQINEKFSFSTQAVDAISEICVDAMRQAETDRKDVIRVRLSIEEILEHWLGTMEGSDIAVKTYTRFGRNHVEISAAGPRADDSDDSSIAMFGNRLLAQSGVAPVTSYKNGCNILSLTLYKKRKMSPMALLILSIVLGALFGLLINALPESVGSFILSITGPIFSKLLDLLRLVAMPMILLGVCGGIVGMGDIQTISKIGRTIIFRFVLYTFVIGAVLTVVLSFFVPVSFVQVGVSSSGFEDVFGMILDIIPGDFVSPFISGNALQIIFLGAAVGIALLVLGDRMHILRDIVGQLDELVNWFMRCVGKLLPVFVFLSVSNMIANGFGDSAAGALKIVIAVFASIMACMIVYIIWISVKYRLSPIMLARKMFPTFFVAFSTSSSSAAMSTNIETCERKLGIPHNVTQFALPLGQVVFMPAAQIVFMSVAIFLAEAYNIAITPTWLITATLSTCLMAMAAPPIPGGSFGVYAILFAQLGIPAEALAVALALDSLFDPLATAADLACLQGDLIMSCGQLGILDKDMLREEIKPKANTAKK